MKTLQLVIGILTLGGVIWTSSAVWAQHLRDDQDRDEQIRILKSIAVAEHPEYTLVLFPEERRK